MSEAGEPQPIETVVNTEEATSGEQKPKERVKRPTRPDDAAHKQKVEALQATSEFQVFAFHHLWIQLVPF